MKLALLGTDDDLLAIAAVALAAGHQIDWVADIRPADEDPVHALLPGVTQARDWEDVLDHALADAVLVGRGTLGDELRCEYLKRMVSEGVTLLVMHPISTSVLPFFELDMARDEAGGILLHYAPLSTATSRKILTDPLDPDTNGIGLVHQVVWQRNLADYDRETVLRALARDVEPLLALMGGVTKVSAAGPHGDASSYASLNVQLIGTREQSIHWSVAPMGSQYEAQVKYLGAEGERTLQIGAGGSIWQAHAPGEQASAVDASPPHEALARLERAWHAPDRTAPERSSWEDALRAMEVVDAVELSLQKQRMISIVHQRLTDQLAFRGVMSAFGCGLLLLAMLVILVAGVAGDLLGFAPARFWPFAMLAVLSIFLLLQLVPYTRSPKSSSSHQQASRDTTQPDADL